MQSGSDLMRSEAALAFELRYARAGGSGYGVDATSSDLVTPVARASGSGSTEFEVVRT